MDKHVNVGLFVPHAGCPHRCSFCDQRAISGQLSPLTPEEVEAACRTAAATMQVPPERAEIAFFGGSFTAVPREYRLSLLRAARPYMEKGLFGGIRISTRPDAVSREILRELREYGVTAVELGAQSMDPRVLEKNRRGHSPEEVRSASGMIREAGLSLGLQMMTGLPGDTDEGAWNTARELAALRPDTVRIYPTLVMEGTALSRWYQAGLYTPQALPEAVDLCAGLLTFFEERDIRVIRLGLHAEEEMTRRLVAGPWHPAFRELCESRLYLERALEALETACAHTRSSDGEALRLLVHPAAVSKMTGQRRENVRCLLEKGYRVTIAGDRSVPPGRVRVLCPR